MCHIFSASHRRCAAIITGHNDGYEKASVHRFPSLIDSLIHVALRPHFLVSRYFTLFMNLLNDVADDREKRPEVRDNNVALRSATVQAMSNLLNANVESGLVHAIGLGYHRDPQSR
ncbi:unnamed protein product [Dicrocoelium dendriticum]|nr:unnamed protein product [Dicrocoelium dendriticum]